MSERHFFEASYEFLTDDRVVRSTTQLYEAEPSFAAASADAVRWWQNRHAAMPEWFNKVLCIKVHSMKIHRVEENGYLPSGRGFMAAEWKCDTTGLSLEDWVKYLTAKEERK